MELRLPLEVDMKPDQTREDVPTYSGAIDPDAVAFGLDEQRRFERPNGAKPKWPRHGLPSPDRQLPRVETQFEPDQFEDGLPKKIEPGHRIILPAGNDGLDLIRSPNAALIDTVARLQLDMEEIRSGLMGHQILGGRTSPGRPRQVAFTSTKVLRFARATSWEQYRQVFDAIVLSNGWDDATAALQLLSHLEGDTLNMALLVPETRQATRVGLVGALTAHYGSPGRLADYRRQFEKTTQKAGEDPSIFAIALETLAEKAFGDMGHTARLRIIRDRFIAGHDSCDLRQHLDRVSPETPIRDIVDRCRVWESHADSDFSEIQ